MKIYIRPGKIMCLDGYIKEVEAENPQTPSERGKRVRLPSFLYIAKKIWVNGDIGKL